MSITDFAAKNAKPKEKSYRLRDDRGLYLRVDPTGAKYWILRYWIDGREHQKSLGPYPTLSLREAREKRDALQNARARGETLADQRVLPTFGTLCQEWREVRMKNKAASYLKTLNLRLKNYVLPALADVPIDKLTTSDVLRLCRKIENKGYLETAQKVRVIVGQVMRYAIASGWIENDITTGLTGALQPVQTQHMATVTAPDHIAAIYSAMWSYPYPVMRCALLFSLYTAARPGEVRRAEWSEIHGNLWMIPAEKMKMRRVHVVPLSTQCMSVLHDLQKETGAGRWLYPSARGEGPMSDGGVRSALRSMGFGKDVITPHGFRAMFSTVANNAGWAPEVIESALAHQEQNKVRAAYNHADYLAVRIKLAQWWSDYLDGLLEVRSDDAVLRGRNVISLHSNTVAMGGVL